MKDWTLEQAQDAQKTFLAEGGDDYDPAGPFCQWAALQQIEQWRQSYEAGDSFSLLHAISECARCKLVMPEWVIRGFLDRYRRVIHYKVRSLDEAFGTYLPKGAKLPARSQEREKGLKAYMEVKHRSGQGEPIDEQLFANVGEELGVGGSKVRDYYYKWKERLTYKNTEK